MLAPCLFQDSPFTNAGMGSNLNLLGEIECDASIMDGKTLHYGAASGPDCELPAFYEGVSYPEGGEGDMGRTSPPQLHPLDRPDAQRGSTDPQVKR